MSNVYTDLQHYIHCSPFIRQGHPPNRPSIRSQPSGSPRNNAHVNYTDVTTSKHPPNLNQSKETEIGLKRSKPSKPQQCASTAPKTECARIAKTLLSPQTTRSYNAGSSIVGTRLIVGEVIAVLWKSGHSRTRARGGVMGVRI
jgi:hypothetical protein